LKQLSLFFDRNFEKKSQLRGRMEDKAIKRLYYSIAEVSRITGLKQYVLRYWETEFSDIRPKRANSKQRLYRRKDVELILQIKTLLHGQGYTIAGARKALKSDEHPPLARQNKKQTSDQFSKKMTIIKEQLQELQKLLVTRKT